MKSQFALSIFLLLFSILLTSCGSDNGSGKSSDAGDSDPSDSSEENENLKQRGSFYIEGTIQSVAHYGDYLYVGGHQGISIYEISGTELIPMGQIEGNDEYIDAQTMEIKGNYLIFQQYTGLESLISYDLENPIKPKLKSILPLNVSSGVIDWIKSDVFAINHGSQISFIRFSEGVFTILETADVSASFISIHDDKIILGQKSYSLDLADYTLLEDDEFSLSSSNSFWYKDLYWTMSSSEALLYNVTDPENPVLTQTLAFNSSFDAHKIIRSETSSTNIYSSGIQGILSYSSDEVLYTPLASNGLSFGEQTSIQTDFSVSDVYLNLEEKSLIQTRTNGLSLWSFNPNDPESSSKRLTWRTCPNSYLSNQSLSSKYFICYQDFDVSIFQMEEGKAIFKKSLTTLNEIQDESLTLIYETFYFLSDNKLVQAVIHSDLTMTETVLVNDLDSNTSFLFLNESLSDGFNASPEMVKMIIQRNSNLELIGVSGTTVSVISTYDGTVNSLECGSIANLGTKIFCSTGSKIVVLDSSTSTLTIEEEFNYLNFGKIYFDGTYLWGHNSFGIVKLRLNDSDLTVVSFYGDEEVVREITLIDKDHIAGTFGDNGLKIIRLKDFEDPNVLHIDLPLNNQTDSIPLRYTDSERDLLIWRDGASGVKSLELSKWVYQEQKQ